MGANVAQKRTKRASGLRDTSVNEEDEMLNLIEETNSVSAYQSEKDHDGVRLRKGGRNSLMSANQNMANNKSSLNVSVVSQRPPLGAKGKVRSSLGLITAGKRVMTKSSRQLDSSEADESTRGEN